MTEGAQASVGANADALPVTPAQARAAHAYASTLLDPEMAGPAAEDAIAAFHQALAQRGDDIEGGPESPAANETLLALTRLMAAVSVPDRSQPEDRRQAVWASIGAASHCTCRESAALMATRANGNIQPRESAALDEHLSVCANCRDLAARTATAERAFREQLIPPRSAGFGVSSLPRSAYAVLAALVAVGVGVVAFATGGGSPRTSQAAAPIHVRSNHVAIQASSSSARAIGRGYASATSGATPAGY